jgi:DNA-binding beta-propeller fold protein YncE
MKENRTILLALLVVLGLAALCEAASPLELVQTIPLPGISGRFDAFGVDVKGNRLFVTPLDHKSVEVVDLKTGKVIHSIPGIEKAHAVLYRGDLNEIFVTDGPAGSLKIFKADSYDLVKEVKPLAAPDGILYDPSSHKLYIVTGGDNAKLDYSLIAVVDTDKGEHVGDIRVDSDTVEEMRLESSSQRLFAVNRPKNRIDVADRERRTVLASWPLTLGSTPVGLAFDESNHRLFVGCRSEKMVVLDSTSGKEITSMPIAKGIDGMVFDPATKRIYSEANTGAIDVFQEVDPDHYQSLGTIPIGTPAKPGLLVPELNRYFVAVPPHGDTADAQILVYQIK